MNPATRLATQTLYDAVIFDVDGTLADSLGDIGGAMNEALAARGWPEHPLPAYNHFIGEGVEKMTLKAMPAQHHALMPALVDEYRARYALRIDLTTRAFPGVPEMLKALELQQVPMAVLSNKRDDFTVELVRRLFATVPFVEVRGEREGVPRKPHPRAALELAKVLGVEPARCAFVGDTPVDIKTGVSSGMVPVGVIWGFRSKDELLEHGAKFVISEPDELVRLRR